VDVKGKPLKPDKKLALKTKLFSDRDSLLNMFMNETDVHSATLIKMAYDLVNSYIDICTERNKF
jgi:hypothetical protein